jgi:3-dehydroquinate synthetase
MTRLDALPYPVTIDADVKAAVVEAVRAHNRPVVVLADRAVADRAAALGRAIGRRTAVRSFALGERRKNPRTLEVVLDALADARADRETIVVGMGGGVAGDLFGFAAAVYMRGVPFVNVATSLVAMVDAAGGGKSAVDLRAGKNLAGAFRDPIAGFCDIGSLATLPERHLREGLAELVKHGIIEGGEVFESLETLAPHPLRRWPWETVIADSLRVKSMYVAEDPLERGARETLNLGHTFAHAIERVSAFRVSHGSAVSIGLRGAGLLALETGRFSASDHLRVLSLLALLRMPLTEPTHDPDALFNAMAHDKKTRTGTLRFVLPRSIGDVETGVAAPSRAVKKVLRRIAAAPGDTEVR